MTKREARMIHYEEWYCTGCGQEWPDRTYQQGPPVCESCCKKEEE